MLAIGFIVLIAIVSAAALGFLFIFVERLIQYVREKRSGLEYVDIVIGGSDSLSEYPGLAEVFACHGPIKMRFPVHRVSEMPSPSKPAPAP